MQQIISSLLITTLCVGVAAVSGCSGEREATFAGQEQPEHQQQRTDQELLEHAVVLLNLEDNEKKNVQGANFLAKGGADSAFALPDLEKVVETTQLDTVREAAQKAIDAIKAGQAGATGTPTETPAE